MGSVDPERAPRFALEAVRAMRAVDELMVSNEHFFGPFTLSSLTYVPQPALPRNAADYPVVNTLGLVPSVGQGVDEADNELEIGCPGSTPHAGLEWAGNEDHLAIEHSEEAVTVDATAEGVAAEAEVQSGGMWVGLERDPFGLCQLFPRSTGDDGSDARAGRADLTMLTHAHGTRMRRISPHPPLESEVEDHLGEIEEHFSPHTTLLPGDPSAQVLQRFESNEAFMCTHAQHEQRHIVADQGLPEEIALANVWADQALSRPPPTSAGFPLPHLRARDAPALYRVDKSAVYANLPESDLSDSDSAEGSEETEPAHVWPVAPAPFGARYPLSPPATQTLSSPPKTPTVTSPRQGGDTAKQHGRSVTWATLEAVFHKPMQTAALELGMGTTTLKKLARSHGVSRWPYRSLTANARRAASAKAAKVGPERPREDHAKSSFIGGGGGSAKADESRPRSGLPRQQGVRASPRLAGESRIPSRTKRGEDA